MNLAYMDVDDLVDLLLVAALTVLVIEWLTQTDSGPAYTARASGDGPTLLTEHAYEHLADGGTIEVDRWHGGTLVIEAYQTVADGGEAD